MTKHYCDEQLTAAAEKIYLKAKALDDTTHPTERVKAIHTQLAQNAKFLFLRAKNRHV